MAVWQDLRVALRALRARPLLAAAATLTLVLGLGSAAAMFAVVYGVLLAPLPYGRPERLVSVGLEVRSPERRRLPQPPGRTSPSAVRPAPRRDRRVPDGQRQHVGQWRERRGRPRPKHSAAPAHVTSLPPRAPAPCSARRGVPRWDAPRAVRGSAA